MKRKQPRGQRAAGDAVVSTPQWRTPVLTEVPLYDRQWMNLHSILDLNDPDEDDELLNWMERLPADDILAALPATHVTLTPVPSSPGMKLLEMTVSGYTVVADPATGKQKIYAHPSLWFQLTKSDRRALQTVYFHDGLDDVLSGERHNRSSRWPVERTLQNRTFGCSAIFVAKGQ